MKKLTLSLHRMRFVSSPLAIRGTDDDALQKSQAIVGVAKVGLGSSFAQDYAGRSVDDGNGGIPWIDLRHGDRNIL